MSEVGSGSAPTRLPRWAVVLLVASLALNLLVVGAVGGAMFRYGPQGGWGGRHPGGNALGFVATLPAERRQQLLSSLDVQRQQLIALRSDLRLATRARQEALAAEPFERARLVQAQQRLLAADARLREKLGDFLVETASKLTPEERRRLMRWRGMDRKGLPLEEEGREPGPRR